jgi:flavin reductase (DIM6/NTAB) family NADH-FMN oxidoreductase RutF
MPGVTKDEFKRVMGSFAAGVTVLTTVDGSGRKHGMTATAFTSLSLDPPLCLLCVDNRAATLPALLASRKLAVNLLASGQEDLSKRFAMPSDDRFAGLGDEPGAATGCPLLPGALATIECEVHDVVAGGDHQIVIGLVVGTTVHEGQPLAYFRGRYCDVAPKG